MLISSSYCNNGKEWNAEMGPQRFLTREPLESHRDSRKIFAGRGVIKVRKKRDIQKECGAHLLRHRFHQFVSRTKVSYSRYLGKRLFLKDCYEHLAGKVLHSVYKSQYRADAL
ncbi:hypothetical protein KIL84_017339 [Mauremys mutica]|uniref:Uncharacterized protein n=1 Tax=Mauremys mutica TaxID=74926 RepID=A0A9D3X6A5_9SAUR|nr:hypothetical protein KIL84_017339 [Mauremys mutica]